MILSGNVFSNVLEMETGISVLVPDNFNGSGEYKVAYLLHGLCANNANWVQNSMLPVYARDYDTVFIMPEVARSFYSDMEFGQKFFTYITEELPLICKSVFHISSKREDTAIIGASMGGYGALKAALSMPEQYGYCCAFSSPCLFLKEGLENQRRFEHTQEFKDMYGEQLVRDFHAIFGNDLKWSEDGEILLLAGKTSKSLIKPEIYYTCGTEDYMLSDSRRFAGEMGKIDIEFSYQELEGGHDFYFFDRSLRKALEFLYKR